MKLEKLNNEFRNIMMVYENWFYNVWFRNDSL